MAVLFSSVVFNCSNTAVRAGPAGSSLTVEVGGRVGVPASAAAAALNVTVDGATEPGFVTVYPCASDRPTASNLNYQAGRVVAVLVVTRLTSGSACVFTSGATHLVIDITGSFASGQFVGLPSPQRLADTRVGQPTADGRLAGVGVRGARTVLSLPVAGRVGVAADVTNVVLTVTAAAAREPGFVTVYPCTATLPNASALNYVAGDTVANTVVASVSRSGEVCLYTWGETDLVVDVTGWMPSAVFTPLATPTRLLDTRVGFSTGDGRLAGKGQRPGRTTLRVPVGGRAGIPNGASAALLNVTAVGAANGFLTMHPRGADRPLASNLNFAPGQIVANATIARLGAGGEVCLFASANTDVIVDVVGYLSGPAPVGASNCPDQQLFPNFRIVALYGNDAAYGLGVLGEQPPDAAAARLSGVAAPWGDFGRPVLGAFEYIATVAQDRPGPDGMYRVRSTDEMVQRYLESARAHGVYLILDIQPGRADFLTEVQRYEKFLREPDVGIALDPEWHVSRFSVPGQVIGTVTASEVNQVAEYVAAIVAQGDLPEKLFVVHQFQERMIPDRPLIVPRSGLAMTYHMDGFGAPNEKLATWDFVKTGPPFHNGFKLFYDEDRPMYRPDQVMALDPKPDLITYQ